MNHTHFIDLNIWPIIFGVGFFTNAMHITDIPWYILVLVLLFSFFDKIITLSIGNRSEHIEERRKTMYDYPKIVDFHAFCADCKHKNTIETEDPCNECLDNPFNDATHRPINYIRDTNVKRSRRF